MRACLLTLLCLSICLPNLGAASPEKPKPPSKTSWSEFESYLAKRIEQAVSEAVKTAIVEKQGEIARLESLNEQKDQVIDSLQRDIRGLQTQRGALLVVAVVSAITAIVAGVAALAR